MHNPFYVKLNVLINSILFVLITANPIVAQEPNSSAENTYTPPRTVDGQPDLQGFWRITTYTPMQRPENVSKEFYTPEEVAEIRRRRVAREFHQTEPGTTQDVHYDRTQFGLARSQGVLAESQRTSMILDPPDGRVPPLTSEGKKRVTERKEESRRRGSTWDAAENTKLSHRCIIFQTAGPPMLPLNDTYQIVQSSGYVMVLVEMIHDVRIIPLDEREQPHSNVRQWKGTSRGHWQGDTLVVETTNFNGKNPFPPNPFGTPASGENLLVTEWFTRVDADTIDYKFRIEDETTWVKPWSAELPMKASNGPIFEFACHEGNYGLLNSLTGARADERRAAEAAKSQIKKVLQ